MYEDEKPVKYIAWETKGCWRIAKAPASVKLTGQATFDNENKSLKTLNNRYLIFSMVQKE